MSQAVISNNSAAHGGGLYNSRGTLTIRQSTISGNSTTNGAGGGISSYRATGTLTIVQSTISGNSTVRGNGAGIRIYGGYSSPGAVVISQSTISGNSSTTGSNGGLYVTRFNSLDLSQSTIVGNSSQSGAAGASLSDLSKTTITNTIIAGNSLLSGAADDLRGGGALTSASRNNLIGNPNTAGGLTHGVNGNIVGNGSGGVRDAATVLNLNLADHGGPVKTHAFIKGSPALDAGSNSLIPLDLFDRDGDGNTTEADPFDQRGAGFSRIANGTVDLGAFEQHGPILPLIQVVVDGAASVAEDGSAKMQFGFVRDSTVGALTVNFGLSGTATSGTDYVVGSNTDVTTLANGGLAGTVTFRDGAIFATITADPTSDTRGEMDESVIVSLLNGTGYQVGLPKSATAAIRNDDASVSIAATNATRQEGDSSTTPFTFTVTRTVDLSEAASVDYAVVGSGLVPANAADFGGTLPTGRLNFAVGESTKTITINVSGDTTLEENETFTVKLSNAVNVGIGTATAVGTIKNNDSVISILGLRSQVDEGQSGTTAYTFTVTRDGSLSGTATVSYAVTGYAGFIAAYGVAPPSADVADFGGRFPSGTVTFAPSESSKIITVHATGDTVGEKNEVFAVRLSNVVGSHLAPGTIASGGLMGETWGIIRNDDNSISIQTEPTGTNEGTGTNNLMYFTISRGGTTTGIASVRYAITGSRANPTSADDFEGGRFPAGTVSFAANEISKLVTIRVAGDSRLEPNETFTVTLSDATGGTLDNATTTGTIWNDDSAFSIAALDAIKTEGNSGSTPFTFKVTRSENTQSAASVKYVATGSGTNRASTSDFGGVIPSGTVNFATGETSRTITINVTGNRVAEPDEGFTVTLNNPFGGSIVGEPANGMILNDDTTVAIAAADSDKLEGDSGETLLTFTVTRTGDVNVASSVDYSLADFGNHPPNAADFGGTMPGDTLSFAAGEASKVIELHVSGDTEIESNEQFRVILSNSVNAVLGMATAYGAIRSDELPPTLTITSASGPFLEGNSGTTAFEFTVTRTGNLSVASSAKYSVINNLAFGANADDFGGTFPSGTIQFAPGETTQTFLINATGDSTPEPDEQFLVTLSDEVLADAYNSSASSTISNDDSTLSIAATAASRVEATGNDTLFTFTVTRNWSTRGSASVEYAVSGSGTQPVSSSDFVGGLATGTVNFADGERSKTITISVSGDSTSEADEGFTVTLSNPIGGQIDVASASSVILDDDGFVSIAATSANKNEGHSGNTSFNFTVTRAGSASLTTTVDYVVSGSGASLADAADFDGMLPSGQVTFTPGQTSKTITINVSGDSTLEADDSFTVTLSNVSNASIATATADGLIRNDDAGFSIAALDVNKREGASGNTPFTFTVTRTGNMNSAVSVNYIARGSGDNPASTSDFSGGTAPSGTVSFAAGETSKTITINVAGNKAVEPDEGFTVRLQNPSSGASLVTATADGLIVNDDTSLSITATDANKLEGDPALGESGPTQTPFTFTVTRTGELTGTSSVAFKVTGIGNRPANAADFGGTFPTGTLTFAPGETSKDIVVNVSSDAEMESVESFKVTLINIVGASFVTSSATGTILSEELPPVISIEAVNGSQYEGHSGSSAYDFTVSRTGDVSVTSSVAFAVTGSGAIPATADDFGGKLPSGTINFAAGETTQTITIGVSGDTRLEDDERFVVSLSNETTADLGTATSAMTIANDDAELSISTNITVLPEGNSGETAHTFLATRVGNLTVGATVDYAVTSSGSGSVEATDGDDFGGTLPSGTLTFAPGESSRSITINVSGDTSAEHDESFSVNLSNSGTDVVTTASASGRILGDDGVISIAATNANRVEGNGGSVPFTFTLTRNGSLNVTSTVAYAVSGSGDSAASASDFTGTLPGGLVTFAPGEKSKDISVLVTGDTDIETDEGFVVALGSPTNASIGTASAAGTIVSDDAGLSITALDANKREGNSGTTPFTFRVTRSGSTHGAVSASYAVRGSGDNAATTSDFGGSFPRGTVIFADGESSKTITINVAGNKGVEPDEDFIVTLSSPVNAALVTDSAIGTIINDDTGFVIEATDASKLEGDSGTTPLTFTVKRIGDLNLASSVKYAAAGSGSTPASAADFGGAFASGTLNFAAGEASQTIVINAAGELVIEPDETFSVTLSTPVGATLTTASATGTILTDDVPPSLLIVADTASQNEGDSGNTNFEFTVTRSGNLTETSSVKFDVTGSGSTPADAADFGGTLPSGTIHFAVGEESQTVVINVVGDSGVELDEAFAMTLSNTIGATLGASSATATIENDDTGLSIAATTAVVIEGRNGYTSATFTVTRIGDARSTTTVNYRVDQFQTDGEDIDGIGMLRSLTFAPGETTKLITLNIVGDPEFEPDERFTVNLSNASGAALLTDSARGTILDDDGWIEIVADSAKINEGHTGASPVTFTVTRTGSNSVTSMVDFTVAGVVSGDSVSVDDFGGTFAVGSLTFAPEETSKTITVNVAGDASIEPDEVFIVTLANSTNAILATSSATSTIINDDSALSITPLSASKAEGNSGTTPFTFTVSRTGDSRETASAAYSVRGSGTNPAATADFGGDFPRGTVTFADGETSKVITINVAGNKVIEPDEGFTVTLSNVVGANLIAASADGRILNDDASVSIAATDASKLEGNSGQTSFTFTVTRTGDLTRTSTVSYVVTGSGTSLASAADFGGTLPTGSLRFEIGEASKTIVVNVSGDTEAEPDESFTITLSNAVGTNIVTASATGVILNDELP